MKLDITKASTLTKVLPFVGLAGGIALAKYQKKTCVWCYVGYGVVGLSVGAIPLFMAMNDKTTPSATMNDTGLSNNSATSMAGQIWSSKAPSLTNIFSSDTDTPMDILKYQLNSKADYNTLSQVFNDMNGTDMYQYLISFVDKDAVDAAIRNLK